MKLLTEYLEHALTFERLAAEETNSELRKDLETQAVAYRNLVSERAARYGLPPPSRAHQPLVLGLCRLSCPHMTA